MVHSGFKDIGGFSNVIGAIDGTHIILGIAPLKQPEIYWNRKKNTQFNVKVLLITVVSLLIMR